jgi:hypothetical protein
MGEARIRTLYDYFTRQVLQADLLVTTAGDATVSHHVLMCVPYGHAGLPHAAGALAAVRTLPPNFIALKPPMVPTAQAYQ